MEFSASTTDDHAVIMRVTDREEYFEYPDIALVDADTGDIEWTYPVGSVGSAPRFCGDDDEMVCLTAWVRGSGDDAGYQFIVLDVDNGLPLSTTPLEDQRLMSTGLFPTQESSHLKHVDFEGNELWDKPIEELFGSDELSPDHGWYIRRSDDGYFFGLLGAPFENPEDDVSVDNHQSRNMAAFDQDTGESMWVEEGVGSCVDISLETDSPAWCRSDGTVTYHEDESEYEGSTTIEGFDPATGETTWSWEHDELGELLYGESDGVFQVTDTVYLLRPSDGDVLLDIESGDIETDVESVPQWCSTDEFVVPGRSVYDDEHWNSRWVEYWTPCDEDGESLDDVVTVPEFVGETAGDYFGWINDGQLEAVQILD